MITHRAGSGTATLLKQMLELFVEDLHSFLLWGNTTVKAERRGRWEYYSSITKIQRLLGEAGRCSIPVTIMCSGCCLELLLLFFSGAV